MSGLGEAFLALKNVMLLHERIELLQRELERMAGEQKTFNASVNDIDKRVVRIEALIEFGARGGAPNSPRIEG